MPHFYILCFLCSTAFLFQQPFNLTIEFLAIDIVSILWKIIIEFLKGILKALQPLLP